MVAGLSETEVLDGLTAAACSEMPAAAEATPAGTMTTIATKAAATNTTTMPRRLSRGVSLILGKSDSDE
jgi:hypothetical protein